MPIRRHYPLFGILKQCLLIFADLFIFKKHFFRNFELKFNRLESLLKLHNQLSILTIIK